MAYVKRFDINNNSETLMSEEEYEKLIEFQKTHTPKTPQQRYEEKMKEVEKMLKERKKENMI